MPKIAFLVLAALLLTGLPARAADLTLRVSDPDGHPLADAVVALAPADASSPSAAPEQKVIDQRDETFLPLVTILRRGGQVRFTNSDRTHHHVYSFSPMKQFELVLEPGEESKPVRFDQPGVAALGCNIHDQMVAYVYVADTPWTVLTGPDGQARIAGIPAGAYVAKAWHPRLRPGNPEPSQPVTVGPDTSQLSFAIPVLAPRKTRKTHEQDY